MNGGVVNGDVFMTVDPPATYGAVISPGDKWEADVVGMESGVVLWSSGPKTSGEYVKIGGVWPEPIRVRMKLLVSES